MQEGLETKDRYATPDDVVRIARLESPVVSLSTPVTAAVPEAQQNRLRHRRAAERAQERLAALGVAPSPKLERELEAFAKDAETPPPWVKARLLFASDGGAVRVGLPWAEDEAAAAGVVPRIRPVLRAAPLHARFRLLALSKNVVRLFEGDPVVLVERPGQLPGSLEEALGEQLSEPSLQLHSAQSGGVHGAGAQSQAMFHGQGGASRERDRDRDRFARALARALEDLARKEPLPLVIAAERRHRAAFEEALREEVGLLGELVDGSPDDLSESDLHTRAWAVVERAKREEERTHETALQQARGVGKYAGGWDDVAQAVVMNRVQRLFLPELARRSGRLDPERGVIVPPWGDEDAGDALAVAVLRLGGAVQVPSDGALCGRADEVCALLR